MRQDITHDVIKEWFRYDPITGWFTWAKKHHYGPDVVGKRAGWQHSSGYRLLKLGDERLLEHRMVWLYVHGHLPTGPIDHIDRDRSNNKLANLRRVIHHTKMFIPKMVQKFITPALVMCLLP